MPNNSSSTHTPPITTHLPLKSHQLCHLIKWFYILPLEYFDDLIKSSHLIICDSSILSILAIFMLLTFLLGHKRICTICTCQCWLVWLKHLLGFSLCEPSENPHFHLPPLREQSDTEHLCVLFLNETLNSLQYARHSNYHNTKESSLVCARAPP
jgi:hypothetical protein